MIILSIKTDQPQAQLGLYRDQKIIEQVEWEAHRQLAETIHSKIEALLKAHKLTWPDIGGIVCYKGPGSFTGLRIGLSVGNALAYGLSGLVVSTTGDDWRQVGISRLLDGENEVTAMPEYGGEIHITKPRK